MRFNNLFFFKILSLIISFNIVFLPLAHANMFEEMSYKEEEELGKKIDTIMKTQAPLLYDPVIQGYVQSIVDNILKHVENNTFDFEVNVVLDDSLNAFATPGGYLFINSGLILAFENESEVAGVLAHEVAHVTQRHIAERQAASSGVMLAALAAALLGAVVGSAARVEGDSVGGAIVGGLAAAQSLMLKYSRQDETEADNVGFEYTLEAGYNPHGYVSAFKKLQGQFGFGSIPVYLSSHPDLNTRISSIEARIRTSNLPHKNVDNKNFITVQNLIRAKYSDIKTAKLHFARQDKSLTSTQFALALLYARDHDIVKAKEAFTKALAKEANNPLYMREYGFFEFKYGDINKAYQLITKSNSINSNDLMTHFYLARTQDELGQNSSAQANYQDILKIYPLDSEVHYYLGHSYSKTGKSFLAYLHLAYSSLYKADWSSAKKTIEKAKSYAKTSKEKEALTTFDRNLDYYKSVLTNT